MASTTDPSAPSVIPSAHLTTPSIPRPNLSAPADHPTSPNLPDDSNTIVMAPSTTPPASTAEDSGMATTTENQPATPTLLGMPAELFERVAQKCREKDLFALRRTCREANEKSLRTFLDTYVSHRHLVLYSAASMERAIEKGAFPEPLPLKKISIHLDELHMELEASRARNAPLAPTWIADNEDQMEDGPAGEDALRKEFRAQEHLKYYWKDRKLLTKFLRQIKGSEKKLEIELCVGWASAVQIARTNEEKRWPQRIGVKDLNRAFHVIMEAVRDSGVWPETVRMAMDNWTDGFTVCTPWDDDWLIMGEALCKTKSLILKLDLPKQVNTGVQIDLGGQGQFIKVGQSHSLEEFCTELEKLPQLTHLHLHGKEGGDRKALVECLTKKQFNNLQDLTLERFDLNEETFVEFVRRHPLLQSLTFNSVRVRETLATEEWKGAEAFKETLLRSTLLQNVELLDSTSANDTAPYPTDDIDDDETPWSEEENFGDVFMHTDSDEDFEDFDEVDSDVDEGYMDMED